jgi:hypothetical protein
MADQPHIPLPTDIGYCTDCRANVPLNSRGRCGCGLLAIWPEGQPRPDIVTDTLLLVRKADGAGRSDQPTENAPRQFRERSATGRRYVMAAR